MSTQTIRQIIARSGLDAYNEEISAACDAIDAQMQSALTIATQPASQDPKCHVTLTIGESKKWRIVPLEPTTGMLIAGNHCQPGDYSAKLVWEKMIEAADRSRELYDRPLWQDCPPASQEPGDTSILVNALRKLACLGNGDRPGNSTGNVIAKTALIEWEASQEQAEPAAQEAAAWMLPRDGDECAVFREPNDFAEHYSTKGWTPLYTTPQPAPASAGNHIPEAGKMVGAELPPEGDLVKQMANIIEQENKYLFRGGDTYMVALCAAQKCATLSAQAVPDEQDKVDAERWRMATDDKQIEGPAVCEWRWNGVDCVYQYRRLVRHEAEAAIDAAIAARKGGA